MNPRSTNILGLSSLSGRMSYRMNSWSLEATILGFILMQSLWNLTGTSAAALLRCLSNSSATRKVWHQISRLRDFTRFGGKVSYRLMNRGIEVYVDSGELIFWSILAISTGWCGCEPNRKKFSIELVFRKESLTLQCLQSLYVGNKTFFLCSSDTLGLS